MKEGNRRAAEIGEGRGVWMGLGLSRQGAKDAKKSARLALFQVTSQKAGATQWLRVG